MVVGLLIRGAGLARRGIGKALKGKKTKDPTKGAASAFVKRKKQLSQKPKKSQKGKALKAGAAVGAGAYAAGQIAEETKKLKKPKTIKPKLGLPPKR